MTYYLIVNKSGLLSTVADPYQYETGQFLSSPQHFNTYQLDIDEAGLTWLQRTWQNLVIIGPGLPLQTVGQITEPMGVYGLLSPIGNMANVYRLAPVEVPYEVVLAHGLAESLKRLEASYEAAKQGRFSSDATGTMYWYDGRDFLLYAPAFVMMNQTAGFTCAVSETADWQVVSHTPQQVQAVGVAYGTQHWTLRTRYMALIEQLRAADSLAGQQAVVW